MNTLNRKLSVKILELKPNDANKDYLINIDNVTKYEEDIGLTKAENILTIDASKKAFLATLFSSNKDYNSSNQLSVSIEAIYVEIYGAVHHIQVIEHIPYIFKYIGDGVNGGEHRFDRPVGGYIYSNNQAYYAEFDIYAKYDFRKDCIESVIISEIDIGAEIDGKDICLETEGKVIGYDLMVVHLVS